MKASLFEGFRIYPAQVATHVVGLEVRTLHPFSKGLDMLMFSDFFVGRNDRILRYCNLKNNIQ